MAIETREVQVAKEVDDVAKLLVELAEDIRAKKGVSEIASENIPNLIAAIDKVDEVDDEFEANRKVFLSTVGARSGELTDAIIGKKKAADPAPESAE